MKCILFKNNKKFGGSENGASLSSWLIQVLIIAFAHGLLGACSPARGSALPSGKVQKYSPLEMVPLETGKSLLGGLLAKKFNAKKDAAAGLSRETINATQVMLWVK